MTLYTSLILALFGSNGVLSAVCNTIPDGGECMLGFFGDIQCRVGSVCEDDDDDGIGICTPIEDIAIYDEDSSCCEDLITIGFGRKTVCKTFWIGDQDDDEDLPYGCGCDPSCRRSGTCCADARQVCSGFWDDLCSTPDGQVQVGDECLELQVGQACDNDGQCETGFCASSGDLQDPDYDPDDAVCVSLQEELQSRQCFLEDFGTFNFDGRTSCETVYNLKTYDFTLEEVCSITLFNVAGCSCAPSCVGTGTCCHDAVDFCEDTWEQTSCVPETTTTTSTTTTTTTTYRPRRWKGKGKGKGWKGKGKSKGKGKGKGKGRDQGGRGDDNYGRRRRRSRHDSKGMY